MSKPRGSAHTTLTETATEVIDVLRRLPGVDMIAPGEISRKSSRRSNQRFVTIVFTSAGFQLIVTGQSTQKIAVHTKTPKALAKALESHKRLQSFVFKERERKPGQ